MKNSNLLVFNKCLGDLVRKQKENRLRYIYNDAVYSNKSLFLNNIVSIDVFEKSPYRNIFLNYFLNAEKIFKGGSFLLSMIYLERFYGIKNKEDFLGKNVKYLIDMIRQQSNSNSDVELVQNIINFSGPDSSILCKNTKNNLIEVIKKQEPQINVRIIEDLRGIYFNSQNETTKDFLTICMDAYLERESEISPVITKAIDTKSPVLIFARGYSDNFIRNIKNIILNNRVYVYLYEVKFDNNDPFLLKDISRILDMQIYSAEAADNLTKGLIEKTKNNYLKISTDKICILKPDISLQKEINNQLKNCKEKELKEYLLKRKKRLTSNITEVHVPKENISLLETIRSLISFYNNSAISGFVLYNDYYYPRNVYKRIESLAVSLNNTCNNISTVVKIKGNSNVSKTSNWMSVHFKYF